MNKQKIILASDHAGFQLKEAVKSFLQEKGHEIIDAGATEFKQDDDYPQYMIKAAVEISKDLKGEMKAILFGGSGEGEAMVANRFPGVRAAVWYGDSARVGLANTKADEIIKLSRTDNDANVLSIGARFVDEMMAKDAIVKWLETPFSGEERHKRRIKEIDNIE